MEIEIIEPGYCYHIYNRGINREKIFIELEDYFKFLSLCKKYLPVNSDLLAYCLLPNHFHLLIYFHEHPERGSRPWKGMCNLCNSYAQWFNKRTGRIGSLFQKPFRRIRIMDDEYLKNLIYYIHRNPLHHNICKDPLYYLFSSYHSLINRNSHFLDEDSTVSLFGDMSGFIEYHKMQIEIDRQKLLDDE